MATLTLRPNAAGTYQAWATFGSPPSHWQGTSDVNDVTGVQVTTSVVSKETENLVDTPQTGTISSVTAHMKAKATGSGAGEKAVIVWRTVNTDYESVALAIARTGFIDYSEIRTVNPNTLAVWTWAQVNALQIGSRASTLGTGEIIQVSEYWIVVTYTPPTGFNKLQYSTEPPAIGAFNKLKYISEPPVPGAWNKLAYEGE